MQGYEPQLGPRRNPPHHIVDYGGDSNNTLHMGGQTGSGNNSPHMGGQTENGVAGFASKGGPGGPIVKVRRTDRGKLQQTTLNPYLIPTAAVELLMLFWFTTMNVLFRFVAGTRDGASMVDYSKLVLSPLDIYPDRPYYNYLKSLEFNQEADPDGRTFGISFNMPEYSFQVPIFILPLLVIAVVELVRHLYPQRQTKMVDTLGVELPMALRRAARFYYVYLLFGSMAGLFTSLLKLLLPIPRPHFMAVCQLFSKDSFSPALNVTKDCVVDGEDLASEVLEALRSFPSYHATIAVYSGAFLCMYAHYSLRLRGQYTTTITLCLPVFVMSAIGSLHRLVTYHASWHDIVWGGVIGFIMAFYAVYGTLNRFHERIWTILPTNINAVSQPVPQSTTLRGTPNYGYSNTDNAYNTQHPVVQPQQHNNQQVAYHESGYQGQSPPSLLPRVGQDGKVTQYGPGGRPTQAFNSSFVLEEKPTQEYNRPRQRYSMPGPPRAPPTQRPSTAYPPDRHRPVSRYEGTSYF